jgi:hypothetical protein
MWSQRGQTELFTELDGWHHMLGSYAQEFADSPDLKRKDFGSPFGSPASVRLKRSKSSTGLFALTAPPFLSRTFSDHALPSIRESMPGVMADMHLDRDLAPSPTIPTAVLLTQTDAAMMHQNNQMGLPMISGHAMHAEDRGAQGYMDTAHQQHPAWSYQQQHHQHQQEQEIQHTASSPAESLALELARLTVTLTQLPQQASELVHEEVDYYASMAAQSMPAVMQVAQQILNGTHSHPLSHWVASALNSVPSRASG